MAKTEKTIIPENPTSEQIQPVEPLPTVVTDDKIEKIEEPIAEKPANVPDISRKLSDEIAKAAKDEKELKKLEEKEGHQLEDETDFIHDDGDNSSSSSLLLYAVLSLLGVVAVSAYVIHKRKQGSGMPDDRQPTAADYEDERTSKAFADRAMYGLGQ